MNTLKLALIRQWGYILIAILSILASIFTEWPTWWLAIISALIIIVRETIEIRTSHNQKLLLIALKLKKLTQNFQGRFVNTSSAYSIFYLIREMGNNEWTQTCFLVKDSLDDRLRSLYDQLDSVKQKAKQENDLSKLYNEFNRINSSYYKLVEEFYNKTEKGNIPKHLEKYYNDFETEYNAFVQKFRNTIDEATKILNVNIDSLSIAFAKELHIARWG